MSDITVPKLNNNDASYVLVEWLVDDGQPVRLAQPLLVLETSKAQEEIESPAEGILHAMLKAGAECPPGAVIGYLCGSAQEHRQRTAPAGPADLAGPSGAVAPGADVTDPAVPDAGAAEDDAPDLVVTEGARLLADEHGITREQLRGLGKTVIRKVDLESLITGSTALDACTQAAAANMHRLAPNQRAVAGVVAESARTIPAAAAYVRVDVEDALTMAERITEADDRFLSLPDLLVKAVALQHGRFPLCFASLTGNGIARLAAAPNVGVTVDVGRGLFVPVVRDAASRTVAQIADTLMDFRVKALRAEFQEREFAGANIMVALHNTAGVVLATPIIFPGQSCVVSLGDAQEQLAFDADRQVVSRRYVNIGLVYDHRLINGRDAILFLDGIKRSLESPAALLREE
jgi:2-oxoglutarate dehydrogenase E2 component (dihydrolipoamide succinyltransferase)